MGSIQPELTVPANGTPTEAEAGFLTVENVKLSPSLVAPGSEKELTLLAGGVRGVRLPNGVELKVTVLAIYADVEIVKHLAQYHSDSAEQLLVDDQFLHDFLKAPVNILVRVAFLLPLTGEEYAKKSGDNTEEVLRTRNEWNETAQLASKKYKEYFKTKNCPPGSSVYFTLGKSGLEISQSFDSSVAKEPECVIESSLFGAALIDTMLGIKGVSPQLRAMFGQKMASLFQHKVPSFSLENDTVAAQ